MQQKGKASLPLWHLFPLYKSCQVHFYLSLTHFLWDTQKHRPKVKKWKKIFNTCVCKHSLGNMIISKKYCFYDAVLSQKLCFLTFFESSSCALFRRPSKQPHFCKFGENFGSGAAILQGMVAKMFPTFAQVSLLADYRRPYSVHCSSCFFPADKPLVCIMCVCGA